MTALTFPRDLPNEFRITANSFVLVPTVEVTPLRSGRQLAAELGPSLWQVQVTSAPLNLQRLGVARAWCDTLSSLNTFNAFDFFRQYPWYYRKTGWAGLGGFDGTCDLVAVAANNVEIDLDGLPASFVLTPGDYLSFDYGSSESRALHRVAVGGVADGSGNLTVEVRPEIRVGWENDTSPAANTITLFRASAKMLIVPGSYQESLEFPGLGRISFRAIQTL